MEDCARHVLSTEPALRIPDGLPLRVRVHVAVLDHATRPLAYARTNLRSND